VTRVPNTDVGVRRPGRRTSQCERPWGPLGRLVLWLMNRRHSTLTDWGLAHVAVGPRDAVLDVGCGGGRTIAKLAAMAPDGTVHGIDHSAAAVAAARRLNQQAIAQGRVDVQEASVSALPFANDAFDLVTAIETHFWWPDLPAGLREVHRVTKPGGRVLLVAEIYNGGRHARFAERLSQLTTMLLLTVDEHRDLLAHAGFGDVQVVENVPKGWICAVGTKPS
jgi:ubiquinone/menaquinone biosynthesis C-methylase UbiE